MVLWQQVIKQDILGTTRQEIHRKVQLSDYNLFVLFAIYALPYNFAKKILWHNLLKINTLFCLPWLVASDFNQLLDPFEKQGGNPINITQSLLFSQNIQNC